jgi:hypothetical protein
MSADAVATTVRGMEGAIRVVVYVVLLVGLFAGAVAYAGNTFGAFDPLDPPPIPAASGDDSDGERARKKKPAKSKGAEPARAPARWVSRANALCASVETEATGIGDAVVRATQRQDWDALNRAWLDAVPQVEGWNRRFATLGSPAGFATTWRRLVARLAEDARDVRRIVAAVGAHDAPAYAGLLQKIGTRAAAEDELFATLGADGCVFGGGAAGPA